MVGYFLSIYLKIFFLLTPFAAVSGFLSMTCDMDVAEKRRVALRTTLAMLVVVGVIFFFGQYIFELFGITLDAFRIGGGILVLLAGIGLVRGTSAYEVPKGEDDDMAVVPMAVPLIVGPGTIAALFIMGAETPDLRERLLSLSAALAATLSIGILLFITVMVEKSIKKKVVVVLSKITGLIISSLAAQMIFDGILGFLKKA